MSQKTKTPQQWCSVPFQKENGKLSPVENHIKEILESVDKLCIDHNVEEDGVTFLTSELNKISQFIGNQSDNPVEALQMLVIINDIATFLTAVGNDYCRIKQLLTSVKQ